MNDKRKTPVLLLPFTAIWRLLTWILGLTGRLIATVLCLVFLVVGILLTVKIICAVVGVPLTIFGFLLLLRGLFLQETFDEPGFFTSPPGFFPLPVG